MSADARTARRDGLIQTGRERVTIFVPTYNRSQWLANAIESALGQTYEDFVLIVSDNCSTDHTREVVETFDDPRLVYLRQPEHLELNEHFNLCYGLARTDYMFLIPDDDVMAPDALEQMIPVLDANPRVGLVHGCARLVDETGTTIAPAHHMTQLAGDEVESGAAFIRRAVDQGYRVHASTALIRTAALADVRLRDDEFPVTDVGLWLQARPVLGPGVPGSSAGGRPRALRRVHGRWTWRDAGRLRPADERDREAARGEAPVRRRVRDSTERGRRATGRSPAAPDAVICSTWPGT